jgi:GntR family transcriptional regulator, transcriptional repressor for pyruvate dehydrogenase complex
MRMPLKAVEKKRAYEDIVQQIIGLIDKGRLKRGDQLPSERELTETFKVSRTTVREAIRTLESMKLLQCRQGNGNYILASSEEALIQPLAAALFSANDDIRDIFYIRKIIEPHIAQLAAENATPQEIEEMEKILSEHERCISRNESFLETDTLFHSCLARATKNRVVERLLIAVVDLLRQSREVLLEDDERHTRARRSLDGHRRVFHAVQTGDANGAMKSMLRHLEDIERIIFLQ